METSFHLERLSSFTALDVHSLLTDSELDSSMFAVRIDNRTYIGINQMTNKSTKAESIIHEFYLKEDMDDMYQELGFKMSVKISHQAAAMFTCIANRFGVNRFDVVAPILEKAATEMFESLNSVDRHLIAKLADEETTRLLHNDGMKQVSFVTGENVPININTWGRIDQYITDQSSVKPESDLSDSLDKKESKK